MPRRRPLPWLAVGALLAALLPGRAPAQELTGVALGPDDEPLAGIPVVLHRVGGAGGAFVATDTTSPDGGFEFGLEAGEPAIYFAALRYEERMYIGPAIEAGGEPVRDYVIRVEPGSEAGAVASALDDRVQGQPAPRTAPTEAAGSDTGAFVLVAFLALAAVGAFLVAAPRYRGRRTRDALIELAEAENRLAESGSGEERARLEARRDRLRKHLAPRS